MAIDGVIFETRSADHCDERRVLTSAFNGDFEANYIGAFIPDKLTTFPHQGDTASWLFYIVSGEASINVGRLVYHLKKVETQRDRLIVPQSVDYEVRINSGSVLSFATTKDIDEHYGPVKDSCARYRIFHLFNQRWAGFTAKQLKFLMPFDKEVILGSHYHEYGEAYSMLRGECMFRLENVGDVSKRHEVHLSAEQGNHLTMTPQLAHVAKAGARSILVGYTAEAFQGADSAIPYKNDWLLFKE